MAAEINPAEAPSKPDPAYLALPPHEREELDQLIRSIQDIQNHVDQAIGVLGEPVYVLGGLLLRHDLMVRTLLQTVMELRGRIMSLEDRVS